MLDNETPCQNHLHEYDTMFLKKERTSVGHAAAIRGKGKWREKDRHMKMLPRLPRLHLKHDFHLRVKHPLRAMMLPPEVLAGPKLEAVRARLEVR